jgi:hypothetical protein
MPIRAAIRDSWHYAFVVSMTYSNVSRDSPTPELTRAEHKAFNLREQDDDESHAIEASGSMSC